MNNCDWSKSTNIRCTQSIDIRITILAASQYLFGHLCFGFSVRGLFLYWRTTVYPTMANGCLRTKSIFSSHKLFHAYHIYSICISSKTARYGLWVDCWLLATTRLTETKHRLGNCLGIAPPAKHCFFSQELRGWILVSTPPDCLMKHIETHYETRARFISLFAQ